MRTAEDYLNGLWDKANQWNADLKVVAYTYAISAINEARKEALEEAARVVKIRDHFIDKNTILDLINELK